jgi:hypothetical protein
MHIDPGEPLLRGMPDKQEIARRSGQTKFLKFSRVIIVVASGFL